jgi:hypothetical protein
MTFGKLWMLAGASLLAVAPAIAHQGEPSDDEIVKALELETARSNALKARYEAEQAAVAARFAPLQNLAGTGAVERGDGAGQMEAAYLAAMATRRAAALIDDSVENRAPGSQVTLLVADEAFSLDALAAFRVEARGIEDAFETVLGQQCPDSSPPQQPTGPRPAFAIGAVIPLVSAVAGLLRTDVTIQGVGDQSSNRLLALAIAGERPGYYVRPALIFSPETSATLQSNEVNTTLRLLQNCRQAAGAAVAGLARATAGPNKAKKDALEAVIARFDAYLAAITTADDGGAVRLATILRQSLIAQANRPILQVYLERGGGSLVTRKNIWTAFGAPAVTASGGVVVSYSLTRPGDGQTLASGFFACNSGMHDLRRVQRLANVVPACQPDAPAQAYAADGR